MYKDKRVTVSFRLTPEENEQLNEHVKESGWNKQQFLHMAVTANVVVPKDDFRELVYEARKQGNNLNQIAKSCNMGNVVQEIPRIEKALEVVENTWQSLRLLIQKSTKPKESQTS